MRDGSTRPAARCCSPQLALLAALGRTVGLGRRRLVAGAGCRRSRTLVLTRALPAPRRSARPTAVTLARAASWSAAVAALVAESSRGRPGRRSGGAGRRRAAARRAWTAGWPGAPGPRRALGARFDMEVDAFLILVLSVCVARRSAVGAADRRGALPVRGRRLAAALAARAGAAALLVQGGRRDPGRRAHGRRGRRACRDRRAERSRRRRAGPAGRVVRPRGVVAAGAPARPDRRRSPAGTGVAEARRRAAAAPRGGRGAGRRVPAWPSLLVWFALVVPDRLDRLTPGAFLRLPVEALVLAAALVLPCPPGRRQVLAVGAGLLLRSAVLLQGARHRLPRRPRTGRSTRSPTGATSGRPRASCRDSIGHRPGRRRRGRGAVVAAGRCWSR